MRIVFVFFFFFLAGIAAAQTPSPLERGIFNEIDRLRTDPTAWVKILQAERPWSPGRAPAISEQDALTTTAALQTLDEAIVSLEHLPGALPRVEYSPSLSRAASDHVRNTGSRGITGHRGADGSSLSQRVERYGSWSGHIGENIVYGLSGPRDAIFEQLLDFGIEDRGHRKTLLNPIWRYVGIACGPHTLYRTMCVVDFASDYQGRADFPTRAIDSRTAGKRLPKL